MYQPGWSRLGDSFFADFAAPRGLPIRACHIGTDAAARLAGFARGLGPASSLLLSDDNTFRAGGDDVARALADAGVAVRHHRLGARPVEGTDALGDEVAAAAGSADLLVAVGSGTVTDLAKYAGDKLGRPVLLYPTAASMNGYTSGITALKVRGLKRTLPCRPAAGVFANPNHVATAPQRMTAAGVADFLSKCSSSADWRASHVLLDVPFDPKAREFFEGIQEHLVEAAPRVGRGDPQAVALVLEALLLSGFSMVIAGSSAPASGGEHLISHYLDMKSALYGSRHDLHGTQVGVATVHCLGLWERILALEPGAIAIDRLVAACPTDAQVRAWIREDWGPLVGPEVQAQWDAKKMDAAALRRHLERVRAELPRLRRELPQDLLPAAAVARAIRESGGPTTPEALDAPLEEYRKALTRARYIRNRFTVLDLAQDLGLP
jgi:glycerol-1-phosphate dehydrogenase [NAD(P)+]